MRVISMENELAHIGVPRKSGRYEWGSGEHPYQSEPWYQSYISMKKTGASETEIAEALGMSTNQLRAKKSMIKSEERRSIFSEYQRLGNETKYQHADGSPNLNAIAKKMNISESTLRGIIKSDTQERANRVSVVSNVLKEQVEKKSYLDIGTGVERQLGVSKEKLNTAVDSLKEQGYKVQYLKVPQATNPGKYTWMKILTKDDVSYSELSQNREKIKSVNDVWISDDGRTALHMEPPSSISSSRVKIRYAEQGGLAKDGTIEINPNAKDLSLGSDRFAQVRIAVDGSHYLKGMAVYGDPKDFPKGVDIIFNTNKDASTPMIGGKHNTVLKQLKDDPDNQFGAVVRQRHYIVENGKMRFLDDSEVKTAREAGKDVKLSPVNLVNTADDWGKWSKSLSSQFLSKQNLPLIKRQLKITYDQKRQELDEIEAITNPAVKRRLLKSYAEDCDSSAVHLKAAALPRQATHVILPMTTLKDNEIYAPDYKDGEEVILIRYPHGGTFEIPRLIVNNHNREGKRVIGSDNKGIAVGISYKAASQLSGADFDGDTVVVIPTKGQKLVSKSPLKGLENFETTIAYKAYDGMPETGPEHGFKKQMEMGKISNLISDMTILGASDAEITRAVKHSMVVIDAEKHNLDWKKSYSDNNIQQLKEKYQIKANGKSGGAATLISRAKSQERVLERKEFTYTDATKFTINKETGEIVRRSGIDPATGKKIYSETGRTVKKYTVDPATGKRLYFDTGTPATTKSTKMAETDDAMSLLSVAKTPKEIAYAEHANKLKGLANEARKIYLETEPQKYNPQAKALYSNEVEDLKYKLDRALQNSPRERQAQVIASKTLYSKKKEAEENGYELERSDIKKIQAQALAEARDRVGAHKEKVEITDREWEAIQAGAISNTMLEQIMNNTDLDKLKDRATPRTVKGMTTAKVARAKSLLEQGYTLAEVSEAIGVSTATITKTLKGGTDD